MRPLPDYFGRYLYGGGTDRDDDSPVVSHVGDVRCGASEVGGYKVRKYDVLSQVQRHFGVVGFGA